MEGNLDSHSFSERGHDKRRLLNTLSKLCKLIPREHLECWDQNGKRKTKEKRCKSPTEIHQHIVQIITAHLSDPIEQEQYLVAIAEFLENFTLQVQPSKPGDDLVNVGNIDEFIAEFPENMLF